MRAAIGVLLGFAACDAPVIPVERPAPAPVTAPAPVPVEPMVPPPAPPVEPPPVVVPPEVTLAGVGPGGAEGRAARREAVLTMLGDGESAAGLKIVASDRGRSFDPNLVHEMTPTIEVAAAVAAVLQREPKIKGPLDKDIIRRIVRAHINEVRYCYNLGLAKDPELGGVVTVDAQILGTGKVGEARVLRTTVPDAAVGECMVTAFKRWSFPRPVGEVPVDVSYPFELAPRGTPRSRP